MKVEKKQSRASVLDKAKKQAISKAVDQYAKSYEEKTGKTVNAEALKSIFIQHADVVENVMTKGGLEEKVKRRWIPLMLWKRWHGRRISMEM